MKKVLQVLAAIVLTVGCGGKGGDKDTRAGDNLFISPKATPAPTGDTSHQLVGAPLAVAQTFTDTRDGKTYRTVKIGKQVWMAENLNYKTDSSWCYDNNPDNCKKYGRLYAWDAAVKACPAGWHLPSPAEWTTLVYVAGGHNAGTKLKSKSNWNGTNDYGFSALPGGLRDSDGAFYVLGSWGNWWTATEGGSSNAYRRIMFSGDTLVHESYSRKDYGFAVRCLRD